MKMSLNYGKKDKHAQKPNPTAQIFNLHIDQMKF